MQFDKDFTNTKYERKNLDYNRFLVNQGKVFMISLVGFCNIIIKIMQLISDLKLQIRARLKVKLDQHYTSTLIYNLINKTIITLAYFC